MKIDHVVVATRDLEVSAQRIAREFGFESVMGGRHESVGTANRIVPFGDLYPQYLELLAATDSSHPFGRLLDERAGSGDRPFAWAVSDPDHEGTAARLGLEVIDVSREMPDGSRVSWQLVGFGEAVQSGGFLPFFISTGHDPLRARERGGIEVTHRVAPISISRIDLSGDEAQLREWLGGAEFPVDVVAGEPGVISFEIATSDGSVTVGRL